MTLHWFIATLHLLARVVGTAAIAVRAWALRSTLSPDGFRIVFIADGLWGLAAMLWIGTGLWRAFGGLEKGSAYYLASTMFWIQTSLLAGILVLELRPMTTLIGWRLALRRGQVPATESALTLSRISMAQLFLVGAMVIAASAMARGLLQ